MEAPAQANNVALVKCFIYFTRHRFFLFCHTVTTSSWALHFINVYPISPLAHDDIHLDSEAHFEKRSSEIGFSGHGFQATVQAGYSTLRRLAFGGGQPGTPVAAEQVFTR